MKTKIISLIASVFVVGIIVFINIFSFTPSAGYTIIDDEVVYIEKGNMILKTGDVARIKFADDLLAIENPVFDVSDQFITLYGDGKVLAFTPDSEEADVSSYDYKAPLIVTNIDGEFSINDTYSNSANLNIEELNGKNSFNKNALGNNDILITQKENDYLLLYGSTLSIDGGAPIQLNPMVNVVTTDNTLTVTELVDGELVVKEYPFNDEYEIIYGNLTISKDSIMNTDAKFEKAALDKMEQDKKLEEIVNKANGLSVDKDGNLIDKDGNRVDKNGNLIDKDGNLIDKDGNKIDKNGNVISGGAGAGAGGSSAGASANSSSDSASSTGSSGGGNNDTTQSSGEKGAKKAKDPKPVIVYSKPEVTSIELVTKDLNPYEKITLKVRINNPDQFNIINIATDDMTFTINEKVNGDVYIDLPPKKAGNYTMTFTEMTVEKGGVEIVPIDKTISFDVYDTPYLRNARMDNKEKTDATTDMYLEFESGDPLEELDVTSVEIDGKNYTNIDKVDNQNFIVKDVDTRNYSKSGKFNLPITNINFTYQGMKHSIQQVQYNVASGVVYKNVFDPNTIKVAASVEYGQMVYNIKVEDPDRSISKVQVDLYETSNDALMQTININGNASGNYKAVFKGVKAGVDMYAKITFTYSKFDASMAQTLEHTDTTQLIIPFTMPSIKEVSFDRFVIDEDKFQITMVLNNPDNFKIDSVTINQVEYSGANLLKSGDNVYRVQNVIFDPSQVGVRNEKFVIEEIKYTDPNGSPLAIPDNYQFEIARLESPRLYAQDDGKQMVDMDFVPTNEKYKLQIKTTYNNKTTINEIPLKDGENKVEVPLDYEDGTVVKVEYNIITDQGFSQKIHLKDSDYFYSNNASKMAYDENNSFIIEEDGSISPYGNADNGALNVPTGKKYDKILYEQGTGVAYSSEDMTATAWGRNSREINQELAKYDGQVVGIDMAEVVKQENFLVSVTLANGSYQLIGNDNASRITQAPKVTNVQKVIPGEYAVIVIDTTGKMYLGGSSSIVQSNLFKSVDYEYTGGNSKVIDASFGEGGMVLYDRNKKVKYYQIGQGQPDFYPGNATYLSAKYIPGTNGEPTAVTYVQENGANGIAYPLQMNPSPYITTKPDYVENNKNPIKSIDTTGTTTMLKYTDGTYNYYGNNVNNTMQINRIQHLPTVNNVTYQTYDGLNPLPGEMVKLFINLQDNYNGVYVSQVNIENSAGKKYSFHSGLAHGYDSAVINNVYLDTIMGNNAYYITSISYANRYNANEVISQDLSEKPLNFSINTSPGLKVNQAEGDKFNVTYGIINTDRRNTIELQYQENGSTEWKVITDLPIDQNYKSISTDLSGKYVKFRLTVKNGRTEIGEVYETDYRVIFDHFTNSSSTTNTYTHTSSNNDIIVKGMGSSAISANQKPQTKSEFTKVETYGDFGFALDLSKNLQVWGNTQLSLEFQTKLAPYQGTIVDFQIVGIQGDYMPVPILNIVLDNGENELIALDAYQPNWDMQLAKSKEMYYAAGDKDIIYFIDKDGNFGFLGANNDSGKHTIDPIPAFILNGTVKIKKIQYTPQAVYLVTNDNVLYVFRKNTTARLNACYLDKSGSTILDVSGNGYNNSKVPTGFSSKKSSTVALKEGDTVSVCEVNEDNNPKVNQPQFILPSYNFPYTKDVQVEALVNGFSYENSTDYYYAGINAETRSSINYLLTPATITTTPGNDYSIIDIKYQAPAVPITYEIFNYDTGTELLANQVHTISNERIYISDLKPDTTYTFDITAHYADASGNKKQSKINNQPIVITTTTKDDSKYIKPKVVEYTYTPRANDPSIFDVKLSVINENSEKLMINPVITNGTIKKERESTVGSFSTYEYTAYTTGMANLSWQVNSEYDWSKPMSYYGNTQVEYFNNVINPYKIIYNGAFEYAYLIYQSPINNKYYPVQDVGGWVELHGTDRSLPENYILDENAVPNPNFNPLKASENMCYPITYAEAGYNNGGQFYIVENPADKSCSNSRPANVGGWQYLGIKNNTNYLNRWDSNEKGRFWVEDIVQLAPGGAYVWSTWMNTTAKGWIDFDNDLVIDYSNPDKRFTPIRYKVTPDYVNTFPIKLYLYVPNLDTMALPGLIPSVNIGEPTLEVKYPYGSRTDVYGRLPQISGVNKYKLYVNEGKDNTSLATAKKLEEVPRDYISYGMTVDPMKDYTFILTYDTDLESDIYLKHINSNSYAEEIKVSLWYNPVSGGTFLNENRFSLILMDDGTIISSSPTIQAKIDAIEAKGIRFTSVNRVVIDDEGTRYSPYRMDVIPSNVECFYNGPIYKRSDGMYFLDTRYGGATMANDDNKQGKIIGMMNADKSTTSYSDVTFYWRWATALQTDYDMLGARSTWNDGPPSDMTHNTLLASPASYYKHYEMVKLGTKIQGQDVKDGRQGSLASYDYFITLDDKLVMKNSSANTKPSFLVTNDVKYTSNYSYANALQAVQYEDGTIIIFDTNSGQPATNSFTKLDGTTVSPITMQYRLLKNDISEFVSEKVFYTKLAYGFADISEESDPLTILGRYNEKPLIKALPFTKTTNDFLLEMGIPEEVYYQYVAYDKMADELIASGEVTEDEVYTILDEVETYMEDTESSAPDFSFIPKETISSDNPYAYSDVTLNYMVKNDFISEEVATTTGSSIEKEVKMVEKKVEKESNKKLYYGAFAMIVVIFIISKKYNKQIN